MVNRPRFRNIAGWIYCDILALYVALSTLSAMFSSLRSSSPASTSTLAQIASIAFWVLLAGTIAIPIVGFILGQKYEKSTEKISSGKIMSIVSGSVVAVFYCNLNRQPLPATSSKSRVRKEIQ